MGSKEAASHDGDVILYVATCQDTVPAQEPHILVWSFFTNDWRHCTPRNVKSFPNVCLLWNFLMKCAWSQRAFFFQLLSN